MSSYYAVFQTNGEVADFLLVKEPEQKLLVDVSLDPPGHENDAYKKYPNRTTFTIYDQALIERFMREVVVGCNILVKGFIFAIRLCSV